jgi:hypothetical protein
MASTIPYHPSLVLGNIVSKQKIEILKQIADLQSGIDAALEDMNEKIALKMSIDSAMQEMVSLDIDTTTISDASWFNNSAIDEAKQALTSSTKKYITERIKRETEIAKLKTQLSGVIDAELESPVDYNKTIVKKDMPLSFDSLKLDARYFSFDEVGQDVDNEMRSLKSFISASTSFLGTKRSAEITNSAQNQVSEQREHHDIKGTLVFAAGCTHENALLLAPFILDVDKGIRSWNQYHKDKKIKINDLSSMVAISAEEGTDEEETMEILSGATCGSSFVGMVHVLRVSTTESRQAMVAAAAGMQGQMEVGGWFAQASGGFGVDGSFASDVKQLLSQQEINSHVSLITMGMVPDIKSSEVTIAVKQFANYDPAEMMGKLAALQNATASEKDTVGSQAQKARDGATLAKLESTKIQSLVSGLAQVDDGRNQMLDINSLMSAFSSYIEGVRGGKISGVPLNYYLKPITRAQLAQMWVAKYYPEKGYLAISGDDSGKPKSKSGSANTSQSSESSDAPK